MEELRSTEILDKEIEADARKKAERILADSERESARIIADVADRVEASRKERSEYYESKITQFEHDSQAALPLEKQRYLVSFIEKAVSDSIDEYLKSLSSEKRFDLIKAMFNRFKSRIEGKKVKAYYYGFEEKLVKSFCDSVAGGNLVSLEKTTFEKTMQYDNCGITVHEGVIIEAEDKTVRCRLTLEELVREIEEDNSKVLAETLFGGRLPA